VRLNPEESVLEHVVRKPKPLIWSRQLGQAQDAAKLASIRNQAVPRWARLVIERYEREQLKNNQVFSDGR
jgi:hypothetical protein